MGFRFRKSIKVGGVSVNFGKKWLTSVSTKAGPVNANLGRTGVSASVSFFGTGLSYIARLIKW